jgi:two-component system sensor histidine kinase DesK
MKQNEKGWWSGPLPWLAYMPFFFIPWLVVKPTTADVVATLIGLCVFLPTYLVGSRWRGARLAGAASLVLATGLALAWTHGVWTIFAVYASAMFGQLRPARGAMTAIGVTALLTGATGLLLGQPWLLWAPGLLLVLLTGGGTMSREAFYDKTVALLESQEEVRRLAGTAERERITRDLHDVVGRTLTLTALKADLAARLVSRDPGAAEAEMRAVAEAARAGLSEVRAALAGQAGGSLSHEASASAAALRAAGIEPELAGDPASIPADAGAVLAMTLREAVTNVIRHADARSCSIELARSDGAASLTVTDDGRGGHVREGLGLTGMRQRLSAAGGTLQLTDGRPGIRLFATVPA